MKKILEFLSENVQFLEVKVSIYLNRRVFVMVLLLLFIRNIVLLLKSVIETIYFKYGTAVCGAACAPPPPPPPPPPTPTPPAPVYAVSDFQSNQNGVNDTKGKKYNLHLLT